MPSKRMAAQSAIAQGTLGRGLPALALAMVAVVPVAQAGAVPAAPQTQQQAATLLNASHDTTREFYREVNVAFEKRWQAKTGQQLLIQQSHGGSAKQAAAVIRGLEADVVTLALAFDIDTIARAGLMDPGWSTRLPNRSGPYTTTVVFLVRKGNPRGIKDWDDLTKPGVSVIMPNPKTSGGGRWGYLAAWGAALRKPEAEEKQARELVRALLARVAVFDTGGRSATATFVDRGVGDVLVTLECEALRLARGEGHQRFEVVVPPATILVEPRVALVDQVVDRRGTRAMAQAYLDFLFSAEGQALAEKHHLLPYRPTASSRKRFPSREASTFTVDQLCGGWDAAQEVHFSEAGLFDALRGGAK
jgi:sulfate/thiosulfate-binding protein